MKVAWRSRHEAVFLRAIGLFARLWHSLKVSNISCIGPRSNTPIRSAAVIRIIKSVIATTRYWPARLDLIQSASGLFLGLFMWGHMAFVSTILISNDAMWWVTKMFEGQFVFGRPYPAIVSCVVALVSIMFVLQD